MKDQVLCIPVTTHTLYQSQTHYGFINVYGHQFLCILSKARILRHKKKVSCFCLTVKSIKIGNRQVST